MLKIGKGVEFGLRVPVIPSPQPISSHPNCYVALSFLTRHVATNIHVLKHQHHTRITHHLHNQTTSYKPTLRPPQNAPELDPVNNELSSYLVLCFSPCSNTFSLFLCLYTHQKRPQNRFILLILNHFGVIFIIFPLFSLYFAKNHAKNFYPGILGKTIAITAPLVYNKV